MERIIDEIEHRKGSFAEDLFAINNDEKRILPAHVLWESLSESHILVRGAGDLAIVKIRVKISIGNSMICSDIWYK